jgi:hypothetical protein
MSDNQDETEDDVGLTKPKKARSDAQKAAFEKMKNAKTEKQLRLQAIKEQLNGATLKQQKEQKAIEQNISEEDEPVLKSKPKPKPKKEPKIIYESASESEDEIIIVKKKKKQKPKKTIIYESATESEEEPPPPKTRDTKTQQNASSSKFKVTQAPPPKPLGPVYYFA